MFGITAFYSSKTDRQSQESAAKQVYVYRNLYLEPRVRSTARRAQELINHVLFFNWNVRASSTERCELWT